MKTFLCLLICSLCFSAFAQDDFLLKDNLDRLPDNVGGKTELQRFYEQHVVYPDKALKEKKEGTVRVKFTLLENGKAINPSIVETSGSELDQEAMRLFRLLEWIPGEKDGKKVNTYHFVSFTFDIDKYKKFTKKRGFVKPKIDKKAPPDTTMEIFERPDKVADYYMGEEALADFIRSTLEYPQVAKQQNLQGVVELSFVVEQDGRVSNISIVRGVGGGCNEEAISLIGETRWKPAVHKGKTVRSRYRYAIQFTLENNYRSNEMGEQK